MQDNKTTNHEHQFVPWRRYVLLLGVDNQKKIIARIPRRDTAAKVVARLSMYKGYNPEIFDTKTQQKMIFSE